MCCGEHYSYCKNSLCASDGAAHIVYVYCVPCIPTNYRMLPNLGKHNELSATGKANQYLILVALFINIQVYSMFLFYFIPILSLLKIIPM